MDNINARFWSKVGVKGPDECWEWTAGRNWNGYGRFRIGAAKQRAHRVAWSLTNGPIPEGLCILHKCDNRLCCNPRHLFLGTRQDNAADREEKGRTSKGEDLPQSKLTEEDVIKIRVQYKAGGTSYTKLSLEFNIGMGHVGRIVRGEAWEHLLEDDIEA